MTVQDNTHITENADLQDKVFLSALPMWLQNLKKNFWPIHPQEYTKFFFLSALIFLMSLTGGLFVGLKDFIGGFLFEGEQFNYFKTFDISFVFSLSFILLYGLLAYKLRPRNIFYVIVGMFSIILLISAISFHIFVQTESKGIHSHFWGSTFYLFANFWNIGPVGVVLWSVIHQMCSWNEAKRFYLFFFLISALAHTIAKFWNLNFDFYHFINFFLIRVFGVILLGVLSIYLYYYGLRRMENIAQSSSLEQENPEIIDTSSGHEPSSSKTIHPLRAHPKTLQLSISSYIGIVGVIIVTLFCFQSAAHIFEIHWDYRLQELLHPKLIFSEKTTYYDRFIETTGLILALLMGPWMLRTIKWHKLITLNFTILLIGGTLLFFLIILPGSSKNFIGFPLYHYLQIDVGLVLMSIIKALKWVNITVGLPMIFTVLNYGGKTIGLSIFEIFGKTIALSGGAFFYSFLLTFNNVKDISAIAPSSYLLIVLLCCMGFLTAFVLKYRLRFN